MSYYPGFITGSQSSDASSASMAAMSRLLIPLRKLTIKAVITEPTTTQSTKTNGLL